MNSVEELKKEIRKIKTRNKRVEADKAWETSWTRKLLILILTYLVIITLFFFAKLPSPLISAIPPSVAFLLSTMTIPLFKKWWIKKQLSQSNTN